MSFLALDAMLGWKVKKYDGSWTEWGNLSDGVGDPTPGDATLVVGSPWATNNDDYTDNLDQTNVCSSGSSSNCGRTGCETGFVVPDQTNENDKQICDTGVALTDCNGVAN